MINKDKKDGKYFTNDQIKEMNRKVSDEVELVNKKKKNKREGEDKSGEKEKEREKGGKEEEEGGGERGKGSDKEVEENWKNLWKEGKDDGIGYNLYRK